MTVNPQYITDTAGKRMVILTMDEFEMLIEQLEDLEDIRLYDESKEETGESIAFEDAVELIEKNRKNES